MPANFDRDFERTFSDLSFAHLQDKAPALLDYLVGFQVLDVNDEQTKAVGVFGCKLGDEWLYLPMFFMNGELKGHELMYLKNQDLFVPLEEAWVHYLLNRKPYRLGDSTDYEKKDILGGAADLLNLRSSPQEGFGKASSVADYILQKRGHALKNIKFGVWKSNNIQGWAEPYKAVQRYVPVDKAYKESAERLDLINFLKEQGPGAAANFIKSMTKSAAFGNLILRFYPVEKFQSLNFSKPEKKAENLPDVRIITMSERKAWQSVPDLNDEDRARMLKGEIVIKDHREDTSKVYKFQVPETVESPKETGIYKILTAEGDVIRCLVVLSPMSVDAYGDSVTAAPTSFNSFHSERPGTLLDKEVCVVNLQGNGAGCFTTNHVAGVADPKGFFGFASDFNELSELDSLNEDDCGVIVASGGSGTRPFCVLRKSETPDGNTVLFVSEELYPGDYIKNDWQSRMQIVIQKDQSGRINKIGKVIFAPADSCRVVKIKRESAKKSDDGFYMDTPTNAGLPALADPQNVENAIWRAQEAVPMKLYSTGTEYAITLGDSDYAMKTAGTLSARNAVDYLTRNQGIRGDVALEMLKEAQARCETRREPVRYWVKYAEGYPRVSLLKKAQDPFLTPGPGAPGYPGQSASFDPGTGLPMVAPEQFNLPAEEIQAGTANESLYDPDPRLDQSVFDATNQAAGSGQKEVFDTALIGSLVKTVDSNSLTDRYIGDLILGMDRVGRVYFLYLQHNEDFAERYGEGDMVELEESLKNTFKSMGDLIMFLKQKTVESSPAVDRTMVELN